MWQEVEEPAKRSSLFENNCPKSEELESNSLLKGRESSAFLLVTTLFFMIYTRSSSQANKTKL